MTLPVGPRGQLVAVALVLIPVILLLRFVVGPLVAEYRAFGDEIASMQRDITRYRRVIAELPALEAAEARFAQSRPMAPFLVAGENAALASAGLQRHLQRIVAEAGGRIVSVRVQSAEPEGPLERISMQARLQVDSRSLRDILHTLEAGSPFVFIDSLNIHTRPQRGNIKVDRLEVRMDLSALREPGAGRLEEQASG